MSAVSSLTLKSAQLPVRFKLSLAGFITSLAVSLLAIVDFRRGFLFTTIQGFGEYFSRSPYHALSFYDLILLSAGVFGMLYFFKQLRSLESAMTDDDLEKYVKIAAFIIFGLLVLDLFAYRGGACISHRCIW